MRLAVVGGGSWGTALAHLAACAGHNVIVLVRKKEQAQEINKQHTNERSLPQISLNPRLAATINAEEALNNVDVCLLAIPVQQIRGVLRVLVPFVPTAAIPVSASKGMELGTLKRVQEIVSEEWPKTAQNYAALSGPSFAQEVALGKPAAVVIASENALIASKLQSFFSTGMFRVYTSVDVVGVECCGAMKNVMAIAAGFCDGMNFGLNARAALITRGLAEMSRLGIALGGEAKTFMGLSGMGDLVLTCTGDLSRNRRVGLMLGQGKSVQTAVSSLQHVAEGVTTAEAVCSLAEKKGIELPICETMLSVMRDGMPIDEAVQALMNRELKQE